MYEGLTYQLSVSFSEKYPYEAPTVKFETACFHPNVDTAGNICLDILKVSASPPSAAPPRRAAAPALLRLGSCRPRDTLRAGQVVGRLQRANRPRVAAVAAGRCVGRPPATRAAANGGARCRPQQRQPAEHIRRATLGRPRECVCTPSLPLPSSQSAFPCLLCLCGVRACVCFSLHRCRVCASPRSIC